MGQSVGMGFERDIEVLRDVVLRRDPAFAKVSVDAREAALRALGGLDERDDFLLAAMRVAALGQNGHSRVIPNAAITVVPHRIVLRDGRPALVIEGVARPIQDVNGVSPAQLMRRWSDVLAGNAARRAMLSGIMLAWPAALKHAGLEVADGITYRLEGDISVRCDPSACVPALPLYPVSDPGFLDPSVDDYGLASGSMCVLLDGVCRIRLADLKSVTPDAIAEAVAQMERAPASDSVVDLRGNPGGSFLKALPLIDALDAGTGRCAVLVNAYTFSAAIVTAVLICHRLGPRARLFGADMGDDLTFWAEGGTEALGQSGADLRFSKAWHDWENGQSDATTPSEIAQHLVAGRAMQVTPVPEADQLAAACAFARGG